MPDEERLPSLLILAERVESERATINAHAESLDAKAGVVLGFAGVLVGLGATAQSVILKSAVAEVGLGLTIGAAVLAAWAFRPKGFPVLDVRRIRDKYLAIPEAQTQLRLLDTQIEMTVEASKLVKNKALLVQFSVACLAGAATLIVIGTLTAGGQASAGKPGIPAAHSPRSHSTSRATTVPASSASLRTG